MSQAPDIIITNPELVVGGRRCDSSAAVPMRSVVFVVVSLSWKSLRTKVFTFVK